MAHKVLNFKIRSESPLLMHSGQMADPLNEFSKRLKAITGKRDKTEADFEEMSRLEWYGSLYLENEKPCIPGFVLEAAFINAARRNKRGKQAQAGILCPDNYILHFPEEKNTLEEMRLNGCRLVARARIGQASVMRTRPKFDNWTADIEVRYDPLMLNEQAIKDIVRIAGEEIGLMDWRPKFGRFSVVE